MGSPISPVSANIYMEYFEELVLGPQYHMPTSWWKRFVDDIIIIVKKEQVDTLINHINSADPYMIFTMEAPGNDSSTSFLDTKYSLISDHTNI